MKLLVVLSAVMACALARPGLSYSSWALPGGLVAAPVAPLASPWAAPIAPTLAVRSYAPVVAGSPAIAAYSAIPAFAPFATTLSAPAEATEKSEAPAVKASEPASDDSVAVEAASADSPAPTETSAPVETPAPAPVEETPAPDAPAPAPAPSAPVVPVHSVAVPVPAWAPAVAPTPILAAPAAVAVASPVTKSQYHAQDELGNTAYGHAEPGSVHSAVQDAAGNRVGSFSYLNPTDGQVHRTDYVADGLGYRVAANDLPVGPAAPVADTPEVVAARAAHLAAHSRARRSVLTTPASTAPLATPVVAHVAAPLAYAAPWAYSAPIAAPVVATSYAAHLGLPATLTTIVNNPGHAVSYRID